MGHQFARLIRSRTQDGADLVEFGLAIMRGENGAEIADRIEVWKELMSRAFGKQPEVVVLEADGIAQMLPEALPAPALEDGLGPTGVVQ